MTKLIWQVAILGFIFLLISIFSCWTIYDAYAESTDNIIITWDYPNPPTDLVGFDLRINEDNATLINMTKDVREWSGILTFLDGNNTLDMRAKDLSGQVSIWSKPCYYDPIPNTPSKVTVTVKVIVIVN